MQNFALSKQQGVFESLWGHMIKVLVESQNSGSSFISATVVVSGKSFLDARRVRRALASPDR